MNPVLGKRVGALSVVYQTWLEASRQMPENTFFCEMRDLSYYQLNQAWRQYMGLSASGTVL